MRLEKIKKAYFVGIKGQGMTALSQVFSGYGIKVSGSDTKEKFSTDAVLKKLKIKVIEGFNKKNIPKHIDLAVVSSAYNSSNNPEIEEIKKRNIPVLAYAQALGLLFKNKYGIAVAGTHGKSTTTAMLGCVLERAGLDPTVIVGTKVLKWQSNARVGKSKYLIAEACEYKNNFLNYLPKGLIITNIEYDHPDFFKNFKNYKNAFYNLASKVPKNGFIIADKNDKIIQDIIKNIKCQILSPYNLSNLKLRVLGKHNFSNAQFAAGAAKYLGVEDEIIKKALSEFRGTSRRLEIKGDCSEVLLIDDFAHHPTEIKASISAVKESYPKRKLWVVFQPHTFTRTKALFNDFVLAFKNADRVIILDIYASAREKSGTIHSRDLAKRIGNAVYIPSIKKASNYLKNNIYDGHIVLAMGAGDVGKILDLLK